MNRRPSRAARVVAHDLPESAELLRGEIAALDLDLDGRESGLALRLGIRRREPVEGTEVAVRTRVGVLDGRHVRLLVVIEQDPVEREVALVHPLSGELLLDLLTEGIDPDLVDQHLDPGAGAVHPQEVLAVEDPHARLGDLQVIAVIELDELVQSRREAGHDRGAAADADLDPADPVLDLGHEGHVVDPGDRVVGVGRGERRLDLAGHRLGRRVADEVADVGAGVRSDVEQLALERARARVAGDIAHRVPAALTGREPGLGDLTHQLGHVRERDVMHLDVLAGRDVTLAQRYVLVDHACERVELVGGDAAHRQLHADHLDVGLALAVNALLEAELDEVLLDEVALEVARGLGVEVVEFALEDRDHVSRHVLEHLWVLKRTDAGAGRGGV